VLRVVAGEGPRVQQHVALVAPLALEVRAALRAEARVHDEEQLD
jgi:hypothetical protein